MTGHSFALVEDFHHTGGKPGVQLLANQLVGHAVVVLFDFNVVVNVHPYLFPFGEFVGLWRQAASKGVFPGFQRGFAGWKKAFGRAVGCSLEGVPKGLH